VPELLFGMMPVALFHDLSHMMIYDFENGVVSIIVHVWKATWQHACMGNVKFLDISVEKVY